MLQISNPLYLLLYSDNINEKDDIGLTMKLPRRMNKAVQVGESSLEVKFAKEEEAQVDISKSRQEGNKELKEYVSFCKVSCCSTNVHKSSIFQDFL